MIDCGREFERRTRRAALWIRESSKRTQGIGKGTHRPYPVVPEPEYLGVSAEGGLYACHRFVGDEVKRGDPGQWH